MATLTLGAITFHSRPVVGAAFFFNGLEDWYSLPDSKSELAENPQGHGAFAPGIDWSASAVFSVNGHLRGMDRGEAIRMMAQLNTIRSLDSETLMTFDDVEGPTSRFVSVRRVKFYDQKKERVVRFAIDVQAADPKRYGAAQQSGPVGVPALTGGITFPIGGTVDVLNLFAQTYEVSTNGMADGVTSGGVYSYSVSSTQAHAGTFSGRIRVDTIPTVAPRTHFLAPWTSELIAGDDCYMSFWIYSSMALNASARVLCFSNGDGTGTEQQVNGSIIAVAANTWTQITVAGTIPADVLSVRPVLRLDGSIPAVNALTYVDDGILKKGLTAVTAFNGATAAGGGFVYGWRATPHESASYRATVAAAFIDFGTSGDDGRLLTTNTGTQDTYSTFEITGGLGGGFSLVSLEDGSELRLEWPIPVGSTVYMDPVTGRVWLDEESNNLSGYLTRDDWWVVPAGGSRTIQFNPIGVVTGSPTVTAYTAPAYL